MNRKLTLLLVALSLLLLTFAQTFEVAFAHAEYDHSEPAANAVVESAPADLRIWMTQELFRRQGENSIEVYNETGTRVDQDDLTIDDNDRTLMQISLPPSLANGVYTVRWVATSSEDGHQAKGEFTFTISTDTGSTGTDSKSGSAASTVENATPTAEPSPTATAQSTVEPPPTVAPTPTGQGSAMPCLGGSAPLMMVAGAVLLGRKRSKS